MYVILPLWQAATLLGAVLATPTSPFNHKLEDVHETFRLPRPESRAWSYKSIRQVQAPETSLNWAGGVLSGALPGIYTSVTGTFIVPSPSKPSGGSAPYTASIWVGIDGDTCSAGILQTGLFLTVNANGNTTYEGWYGFNATGTQYFPGISFNAGDTVVLNVTASNTTWGTALIENKTNGQKVNQSLGSTSPLCFQDVEWIIQDYEANGSHASLANFGTLTFTDAQAGTKSGQTVGTSNAAVVDMVDQQNNTAASASSNSSSVTVVYVGNSSVPTSASSSSSHSTHTGAIVGGAVAGVVGLSAALFLVIMVCRRRRRPSPSTISQPDESIINPFVQTTNPGPAQLVTTRPSSPAPSYRSAEHTNVQDNSEADPGERVVPVPVGGSDDLSMRSGKRSLVERG